MDVRHDLKEQYLASLAMLADCVEQCPDELWTLGTHPRVFWRIALHAAYFTHLYIGQDLAAIQPWTGGGADYKAMWKSSGDIEPYELPQEIAPFSRRETLDYIAYVTVLVAPTLEKLDFDAPNTGFWGNKGMSKLSHEIMSLRHVQGHVGQLSEILMSHGLEVDWRGRVAK